MILKSYPVGNYNYSQLHDEVQASNSVSGFEGINGDSLNFYILGSAILDLVLLDLTVANHDPSPTAPNSYLTLRDVVDESPLSSTLVGLNAIDSNPLERWNRNFWPTVSQLPVFLPNGLIESVTFFKNSSQVTANRMAKIEMVYDLSFNPVTETIIQYSMSNGTTILKTVVKTFTFTDNVLTKVEQVTT